MAESEEEMLVKKFYGEDDDDGDEAEIDTGLGITREEEFEIRKAFDVLAPGGEPLPEEKLFEFYNAIGYTFTPDQIDS